MSARLHACAPRRAFTLIEVMVAMVVFSLVMASLFVSFRTAVRSYDIGITHAEGDQSTRFAVNQITDDLHNIYYLNPGKYNVHRRQREALQNQREQKLLKSGFKSGEISDEPGMEELAPPIDLAFRATDGDKLDDLSFVRYQTLKRGEDRMPWGLARIRYFINDDTLYRAIEDIQKPETDEYGNEIPKAIQPRIEKIANHVKGMDIKYGYWHEGEWLTAPDWNSDAAQYRNPMDEEEEKAWEDQSAADPQAAMLRMQEVQQRSDELPAWAEITFTMTDPLRPEVEKEVRQVVQVFAAQENYLPPDAFDTAGDPGKQLFDRNRGEGGDKGEGGDRRPSGGRGRGPGGRQ